MHQRSPVTLEQARGPVRLLVLTQTLKLILYRPLESNMPLKWLVAIEAGSKPPLILTSHFIRYQQIWFYGPPDSGGQRHFTINSAKEEVWEETKDRYTKASATRTMAFSLSFAPIYCLSTYFFARARAQFTFIGNKRFGQHLSLLDMADGLRRGRAFWRPWRYGRTLRFCLLRLWTGRKRGYTASYSRMKFGRLEDTHNRTWRERRQEWSI